MSWSITAVIEHFGGRVIGGDRGGWRPAHCPMHEDRTPSASINEDKGKLRCFPCDFHGDAIDVVRTINAVGFAAARQYLTESFGAGDEGIRGERGASEGLLVRARNQRSNGGGGAPWLRL